VTDRPVTFSIDFGNDKVGAEAKALARELEETIQSSMEGSVETKLKTDPREIVTGLMITLGSSAVDLPLNFHPAAVRAWANVTPFGAVSVPA
jgi:hypothetical protein